MDFNLTPYQARVIGCLLEKEITTPEQYPLSLNALTNACNQKSNRDPVLNLDESDVQHVLDELAKEHLVVDKSGFGSRTTKYQHRFCNTVVGSFQFTEQELGIICVLLLRGPQTPGELRTRTNRLCKFSDVNEVEAVLDRLGQANNGPFVVKLSRQAGKRESRYAHLFSGEVEDVVENIAVSVSAENDVNGDRLDRLEREIDELRMELAEIKALLSK